MERAKLTADSVNKVLVEPSVRAKLHNLDSRLELCDQSGNTLGFFVPVSEQQRLLYACAQSEFTDEEIEHAKAELGGLNIAEVLADLADG